MIRPGIDELTAADVRGWLERFVTSFRAEADALTELDRQAGDGDFGFNLGVALDRVSQRLAESEAASAGEVFGQVAEVLARAGGSSGPLLSAWFKEFAKAASGTGRADLPALAAGATAGVARVQRLGGAQVGDSTMVDAMVPAAEALASAAAAEAALASGLAAAAAAARGGAESTAALAARRGRASYLGENSRGVTDPGAVAIALFFEAAG